MAEPRKPKPRLTLRDLASVEVRSATVDDVLGTATADMDQTAPGVDASGTDAPADAALVATPRPATSGPVSTRQLQALPEGVSPEVVAMLGLPEASSLIQPDPELSEPDPSAVAPPEPEKKGSRGALFAAVVILAVGATVTAWYATRPPSLDGSFYETLALEEPSPSNPPIVEVAFLPVPDPVAAEESTESAVGGTRSDRPSRAVRTDVREEDLF